MLYFNQFYRHSHGLRLENVTMTSRVNRTGRPHQWWRRNINVADLWS